MTNIPLLMGLLLVLLFGDGLSFSTRAVISGPESRCLAARNWRGSRSLDIWPLNSDMTDDVAASAEQMAKSDDLMLEEQDAATEKEQASLNQKLLDGVPFIEFFRARNKLPPVQIEDTNLLLYDVFLIVNLSLSICFWVSHRMEFSALPFAFSEGCLLSIFWIISGLYHGAFLYSAVDGHYGSADERGGPQAAAALALNTYVNAVNLRLIFALIVAVLQHREVGAGQGEELLPLEIGFGLLLMTSWRALHSYITPRL